MFWILTFISFFVGFAFLDPEGFLRFSRQVRRWLVLQKLQRLKSRLSPRAWQKFLKTVHQKFPSIVIIDD